MSLTTRVLRFRLKDKHAKLLRVLAREVNFVWNYCNELSHMVWQREQRFLSGYDFHPFTRGAGKAGLHLHSQTLQAIGEEYAVRRKQAGKTRLRWRASGGPRRSLGWIPFKASAIRYRNGQVFFAGTRLSLWDSYGLSRYKLGAGSFSEDARGRWYLNVTIKVEKTPTPATGEVERSAGIDLGLKDFAATSDAQVITLDRHYRKLETVLAKAQCARKKARVRALHPKIKNSRKDQLHKLSTALVQQYGAIFIGNVNASALARTRMAKSVLDAGWSLFRTMLQYKSDCAGVWFDEVDEKYSTQTCGCCNRRTGPKGREGLGIREWACFECGAYHHRDINAAVNILAAGRRRLAVGIPVLPAPCAAAAG
ncbi:RNA-guided endonuclease InsQ/TnpB family protein [Paraburkholderia pallida]|uniref:Transposase n=1 Tax=Paraburkholderia pallida TaxID=2547399 RepID=A0A4P7D8G0_9BURK|nr:RNA-guided endonuclease TnpB family protein [Paraburkholderia pallida]QBR03675.1 transposase [Paraburkholderia pallida]QBR03707.1 transposase [Paraburkholderia pallida]